MYTYDAHVRLFLVNQKILHKKIKKNLYIYHLLGGAHVLI